MRVIGIDPGTGRMGFAILDLDKHNKITLVDCGIIETSKDNTEAYRLKEIYKDLSQILHKYKPNIGSVEKLFFFRNTTTVIPVAQARGVIIERLYEYKCQIFEYTPLEVKQIITGNGKADKKQLESFVMRQLGITKKIRPDDAVDAIAIALCFVQRDKYSTKVQNIE